MMKMELPILHNKVFWRLVYVPYRNRYEMKFMGDFDTRSLLIDFIEKQMLEMGKKRPIRLKNIEIVHCTEITNPTRIRYKIRNRGMFEAHRVHFREDDDWGNNFGYQFH
jgi:hypothetical protein